MIRPLLVAVSATSISCTLALADPHIHGCPDMAQGCAATNEGATAFAGGQMVFIDPETGNILSPDAAQDRVQGDAADAVRLEMADQMAQVFSVEGLEQSRTVTGAVALDLQGRFQNPLVAIIGPDGRLRYGHMNAAGELD